MTKKQTLDEQIEYAKEIVAELNDFLQKVKIAEEASQNSLQEVETTKQTAQTSLQEVETAKETAQNSLQEVETAKETAQNSLQEVETTKQTAQTSLQAVETAQETAQNSLQEVETAKETAQNSLQEVETAKQTTQNSLQEVETTKQTAQTSLQAVETAKQTTQTYLQEVETTKNKFLEEKETASEDIIKFKTQLNALNQTNFEAKKIIEDAKGEQGETIESTKTKIENFFEKIKKEAEEFDEEKKATLEDIQDILTKTASIGLATAYVEAKSKYGSAPIYENLPEKFIYKQVIKLYLWLKSSISTIFYYILFLTPLGAMIYLFKDYIFENNVIDIDLLIFRSVISTPLILISLFGLNSIRMNRKLYEEYNHKHRVMQLYYSLKEKGTPEEQQKLGEIMLQTVQDKSSLIKEKNQKLSNKLINEIVEQITKNKEIDEKG